jgi:hypothetical protein
MPFLFCYGSNNPQQLAERIGPPKSMSAAYSPDHKRVFRGFSQGWGGGVASLAPSKTRPAFGYVAQVTEAQLRKMDIYEGVAVGAYARRKIKVVKIDKRTGEASKVDAIAYIASSREFHKPSRAYLQAILKTIAPFWEIDSVADISVE